MTPKTKEQFMLAQQCRYAWLLIGLMLSLQSNLASAEFFPGNLFELRPPRVRLATEQEVDTNSGQIYRFGFQEPPPAVHDQSEILLTEGEPLAFVFPVSAGSYSSGGVMYSAGPVRLDGNLITLDFYSFLTNFSGDALEAPWERSAFIGELEAGTYEIEFRRWFIEGEGFADFDPLIEPDMEGGLAPLDGDIILQPTSGRNVSIQRFAFEVTSIAVPEPSAILVALLGVALLLSLQQQRNK